MLFGNWDQFYSNTFPRGDNDEIVKIHRGNLEFFYKTTGPILTKVGKTYP